MFVNIYCHSIHRLIHLKAGVIHKYYLVCTQFKKIQHPFPILIHTGGAKEICPKNLANTIKIQDPIPARIWADLSVYMDVETSHSTAFSISCVAHFGCNAAWKKLSEISTFVYTCRSRMVAMFFH